MIGELSSSACEHFFEMHGFCELYLHKFVFNILGGRIYVLILCPAEALCWLLEWCDRGTFLLGLCILLVYLEMRDVFGCSYERLWLLSIGSK